MTRYQLINRLGRELGLKPNNEAQKDVLVNLLNDAAYEIYMQTDLPRTLMEQKFAIDSTDPLRHVTLPGYVNDVRAVRRGWMPVTMHDMRPKYHTNPWPKDALYTFRMIGERATCRSIDNAVGLYMAPITGGPAGLEVSIVGRTADAEELHASFDVNGEGSAVGVLWEDIFAINKNLTTPVDVILLSGTAEGDEMARIYNYADMSLYIELEIGETLPTCCAQPAPAGQCTCIEILYKPMFRPLLEDTSVFQVSGYDNVLIYKAVEIYKLRGLGSQATADQISAAKVHAVRADDVFKNTIQSRIQSEQLVINFGRSRADVHNLRGLRAYRYGNVYGSYWWGPSR